jgi:phosphoesterase RecJ-like protein
MKSLTRSETARFLEEHDSFAIVTHRRPDGDTAGSAAVLCMGLRQLGKTAYVLENPEITGKYAPLHRGLTKQQVAPGDTVVSVDVASPNMLPCAFQGLDITLRIDHHSTAESFTPNELVDPDAAACGEIVYDVLTEMGVTLDIPMATALYTAVSTDTGCFRYANTTAHTLRTAAACKDAGADTFSLNQALFETNSLARLRLQGWLVENALFLQDGKIAICALPLSKEQELGLTEDDLENISGFPRTIAGVHIAAMLRQEPDGRIKLSVRAVPGCDAAAICAKFGGGGHKGAAGASMNMTMEEAVDAVKAAMPKL